MLRWNVLEVIEKLSFRTDPPTREICPNKVAYEQKEFVHKVLLREDAWIYS